jgi:ATP-dependent RNA helicase DDX23/PRP28
MDHRNRDYSDGGPDTRLGETSARNSIESEPIQSRRVPISLEDMKRMKEAQEQETSKPVFLTKAQRRAIALKEREAEVAAQRQAPVPSSSSHTDSRRDYSSYSERDSRRQGYNHSANGNSSLSYRESESLSKQEQREREAELEQIRKEKLGLVEVKKRKALNSKDKVLTKVTYWDDSEDTGAQEISSIYRDRAESKPQFGRGSLAGMGDSEDDFDHSRGDSHRHGGRGPQDHSSQSHRGSSHGGGNGGRRGGRNEGGGGGGGSSHRSGAPEEYSWTKKPIEDMSVRDWRILREDFEIAVKGTSVPNPLRVWDEAALPDWTLRAIKDANYAHPTAIQRQAIPIGLQGRDMIGIAETGSGKTASFLIPLLIHISKLPKSTSTITESEGPYACILAPTRELAMQIKMEADKFAKYANCRTVLLIGGEDLQGQVSELRKGCEIIVATAGRLVDLLNNAWLVLTHCHYVVLDEGDRMIDMGFEEQLLQILDAMPATKSGNSEVDKYQNILRNTVLFSATMPPAIERIANKYLRNPVTVTVGDAGKTVDRIKQNVEFYKSDGDKRRRLQELLLHGPKPPIIIFMNHKASCDAIAKFVEKLGFSAVVLHAGKSQEGREWAITEFKQYRADVLVATNVAGRGLDVKGVTHVINFDLPDNIEEYVHRIGRTARAGMDGMATSFLTQNDDKIMPALKQLLQKTNSKIPREMNEMLSHSSIRPVF